eukprot:scaffold321915_cov35-Tisochrysis_lutea.AAC.1
MPSAAIRVAPYATMSAGGVRPAATKYPLADGSDPPAIATAARGSDSPSIACLRRKGTWIVAALPPIISKKAAPIRCRTQTSPGSHNSAHALFKAAKDSDASLPVASFSRSLL